MAEPTQLERDLKEFLETTPLYVKKTFDVQRIKHAQIALQGIDQDCETCNKLRPFHNVSNTRNYELLLSGDVGYRFRCVTCGERERLILTRVTVTDLTVTFEKFGEWPPKKQVTNKTLQRFFKEDLDNYRKATACLAHGYGVGAFAYFRRIVEGNIGRLLDLVAEEAHACGDDKAALDAIAELRKESPMSAKIQIANAAVPPHLKPNGLNPLGRIYAVLSEGVHTLSDEQCQEKAKLIATSLTFLVGELAARKRSRDEFAAAVQNL